METRIHLPPGWGSALLRPNGDRRRRSHLSRRAYDHAGRQLVWRPTALHPAACDLENPSRPVGEMPQLCGMPVECFLRRWAVTEVLAKLFDVPVLLWLKQHGVASDAAAQSLIFHDGDAVATAHVIVQENSTENFVAAFGFLTRTEREEWN